MIADLALAGYAPGTRVHYLAALERLIRRFRRSPVRVGQDSLRTYVAELVAGGVGPSALRVQLAALRFLYRRTLGRPQEVAWIGWPKRVRPKPRVLTAAEVSRLFAATTSLEHLVLAKVLYGTGLRIAEALALKPPDVDARRGVIYVREGKGRRPREVMLGRAVLRALRRLLPRARSAATIFTAASTGAPLAPKAVRRELSRASERAGIGHVTPHTLRHSFATHLFEAGTDLRVLQEIMGHANIASTARYAQVSLEMVARTTSPLDRLSKRRRHH